MKLLIKNVKGLVIPTQANPKEDAGYDVVAATPPSIVGKHVERPMDRLKLWTKIDYIEYRTGLFVAPITKVVEHWDNVTDGGAEVATRTETDYHIELMPRSSISKYNLVLANSVGTIDLGYRNEILVRFKYIMQPENLIVVDEMGGRKLYCVVDEDSIYKQGDKIIQIKGRENMPIEFEVTDELPPSGRNLGGFGSSGR
jgi:dUTPase